MTRFARLLPSYLAGWHNGSRFRTRFRLFFDQKMSPYPNRAALSVGVSFVTLCKIIGIEEREGKEWKRVGLFEKGAPSYKELDAIRGTILKTLLLELDHDDAYMAWG